MTEFVTQQRWHSRICIVMSRDRGFALVVIAITLLLPVALAIAVFPTAMSDTRELMAWGRQFPLVTPVHPPMMAWIGGAVHRFLGSEAAPAIFVGQILLAVGAWYIYAILRLVIGLECAALFAFLYATSFYVLFAPLSFALNADILQVTSWPAILYHFLLAVRCDRRRHWLAFGIWSAVAALTKYSAVMLFAAMAVAVFAVPEFRRVLKRPRLLIGVLVGIVLVLPHAAALVAAHDRENAVKHAWHMFDASRPVGIRLQGLGQLLMGYLGYLAPGSIIVAVGWWKGTFAFGFPSGEKPGVTWLAALRFLIVLNVAIQVALLFLIILGGLNYLARYDAPFAVLAVLALGPLLLPKRDRIEIEWRSITRLVAVLNPGIAAVVAILYLTLTSHNIMQEPTAVAARAVLADWNARYPCGPAYITGFDRAAHGIGIEAGRTVTALSMVEIPSVPWFDDGELRTKGAVVVDYNPVSVTGIRRLFADAPLTEESVLTLPLRRTFAGTTVRYHYRFIPPRGCGE